MRMRFRNKNRTGMSERYCRGGAVWILAFFLFVSTVFGNIAQVTVSKAETGGQQIRPETGQGGIQKEEMPEELGNLYARSAVLMDAKQMRVLISKEGSVMRPNASTTKIMTCILALEEGKMSDVVTVSQTAASQPRVHLGMREGEAFRLEDLLYSLMLESHNDSAVAVAEYLAGSVEAFAEKMNKKAGEIGCKKVHFVTPNGLDRSDEGGAHSISAEDLAKIMSYCIGKSPKAEEFLALTQTREYQFQDVKKTRSFTCRNHNLFLDMMEGALSGKTGFTGDSGYCYVGALEREGRTFVVALLGCGWPNNKNYKWQDTRKLMNYALEHYHYQKIRAEKGPDFVWVTDGIPEKGGLFEKARSETVFEEEPCCEVLLSDGEEVEMQMEIVQRLQAPVNKGEKIGVLRFLLDGEVLKECHLVAKKSVQKRSLKWTVLKMTEKYIR